MKKPINTDNSLKAWRRITISLAAITVVLTVIFSYFLYDSLRNAGTDESKASAADTGTSTEEAKVPVADDAVNIPEEALYYGGNYYWVYEYGTAVTWEEAEEFCEKQGGHLAVITSDELNDMLFAYEFATMMELSCFSLNFFIISSSLSLSSFCFSKSSFTES